MTSKNYIFLVDDDEVYLKTLKHQFTSFDTVRGEVEFKTFLSGEHCLKNLDLNPDIVILDYYLKKAKHPMNGIHVLNEIKKYNSDIQVIMLSNNEDIETAVNCIKHNAFDYVIKNESGFIRIKQLINNVLYNLKLKKEIQKFEKWNLVAAIAIVMVIIVAMMV